MSDWFPIIPGMRFERLLVLGAGPRIARHATMSCRCDCGNEKAVQASDLRAGRVKSCGCLHRERAATLNAQFAHLGWAVQRKHGHTAKGQVHPLFSTWTGMLQRCYYAKSEKYPDYGGRGIIVCERWRTDFVAFLADMGPKPSPSHTLDRIEVNGNYEPGNCRWATPREQALNRRPRLRHRDHQEAR